MTLFLLVLLLLSLIGNGLLLMRGLDAADKIILYENFITMMRLQVEHVIRTMQQVDIRGSFEADDEVGDTFKTLKRVAGSLENFLTQELNGKKEN